MATRTDEPLIVRGGGLEGDDAAQAERLRNDIADTRNHMGRTVDTIEERLSPKNLKAQVTSVKAHVVSELKDAKDQLKGEVNGELHKVREATVGRVGNMVRDARSTVKDAGSTSVSTVRDNPIPAAMVAVGLGWLVVRGLRGGGGGTVDRRIRARIPYEGVDADGYGYVHRHEPLAGEGGRRGGSPVERGRQMASGAVERAGHVAHDARARGQRVVRRAGMQARRAERTLERSLDESPLAFGAVAVALGAAIGLLLPHTEVEDRVIGERRDRLLEAAKDRAEGAAKRALSTVEEKAGSIAHGMSSSASRQNGVSNGTSKHA